MFMAVKMFWFQVFGILIPATPFISLFLRLSSLRYCTNLGNIIICVWVLLNELNQRYQQNLGHMYKLNEHIHQGYVVQHKYIKKYIFWSILSIMFS